MGSLQSRYLERDCTGQDNLPNCSGYSLFQDLSKRTAQQAIRTKEVIEELCSIKRVRKLPPDCFSILKAANYIDGGHTPRSNNAKWHISYYSDDDKLQIEKVMQKAGCDNFELHKGIDECIADFKA